MRHLPGKSRPAVRLYALAILVVVLCAGYLAGGLFVRSALGPANVSHNLAAWNRPVSDSFNGCTAAGCHGPAPHLKSRPEKTIVNLHTRFLHCTMCHQEVSRRPAEMLWVNLDTGRVVKPPAALQITRSGRTDYHAKIVPKSIAVQYRRHAENLSRSAERYLSPDLDTNQAEKVLKEIHGLVSETARSCRDCHAVRDSILNFKALGYPPVRTRLLQEPQDVNSK